MLAEKLKASAAIWVRQADFFLQSYFCLTQELFVENPVLAAGAGIYTAEDWSRNRQIRTAPFGAGGDRYGSDANYLQYLSSLQESKLRSALSLIGSFDFSRYGRIIELGCGDMAQAYVTCSKFPNILYTATDFDPFVIEQCSRLPLLKGIRKLVLDVIQSDLDELKNNDLVVSWSLEFSLENRHLTRLFAACKKHSVPYLLCTHTAIGPISYLARAVALKKQRKQAQGDRLRILGWLRSIGEIARLARLSGMALQWKSFHVDHAVLFFTP